MHLALASRSDIPAFAPEPITPTDIAGWTAALTAALGTTLDRLGERIGQLKPAAAELAEQLFARRSEAISLVESLLPPQIDACKIRHHGDLHLGQILVTGDDIHIIDFEGEPSRSEEERQRKLPAARDVAGFIRSLDYATAAALDRVVGASAEELARLSGVLDQLRAQATSVFLATLHETAAAAERSPLLWPADPDVSRRLLIFFMIEKAVYEIGYELDHRPDWVRVPVAGLARLTLPGPEGM